MIRVRLRQGGGVFAVAASGHASGSVAVCAAVSCLLSALEGALRADGDVQLLADRLRSGDAFLQWRGGASAFALVEIGLRQLEATEPERIELIDCGKSAAGRGAKRPTVDYVGDKKEGEP